jgi:glutaredoxin
VSTITVYTKTGCRLCEHVKNVLLRCQRQIAFEIQSVDISQNPELLNRYANDIPVILLDGVEIARHFVREQQVLERLRRNNS